jgi:hypothetical protein
MNPDEREVLAAAYVSHYSKPHVWDKDLVLLERDTSATEWAIDAVVDITFKSPEELWDFVLEVLRRDPPNDVLEVLAAGPLEDYLVRCGERVMDRVEERAKADPAFRSLLGGVWQNRMSSEVWARVRACWDRSGWDNGV